jgi:hypothetical protein
MSFGGWLLLLLIGLGVMDYVAMLKKDDCDGVALGSLGWCWRLAER